MESDDFVPKEEIFLNDGVDDDFYASEGYSKKDLDIQLCNDDERIKQKFDKCSFVEDKEPTETRNLNSSDVQLRNDVLSRNDFAIEKSKLEIELLQFEPKMESDDYVPKEEISINGKYSSSEHKVPIKTSEDSNFGLRIENSQLELETLEFEPKMESADYLLKDEISINSVNDDFDNSYAVEGYSERELDTQSYNYNEGIKENSNKCCSLEHKEPTETSKNSNFSSSLTRISIEQLMAFRKNAQLIAIKEGFRCGFCPFQNQLEAKVREHFKNYHSSKFNSLNVNETVYENNSDKFEKQFGNKLSKCSYCNYVFNCKENLSNHLKSHFSKTKIEYVKTHLMVYSDECKLYKCEHCDFKTRYTYSLKRHLMVHSGECELHQCEYCHYKTRYKSDLKRHLMNHSEKCYLYKCAHCEFKTKGKSYLKAHLLMMHSDEGKIFKCTHCEFETKYKFYLKSHLMMHSDECEFYKCEHCDFKTKHKSYLKIHLMGHSDTCELYKCAHCEFKTKRKSSLKMHLLVHSGEFHKCEHCDFKSKYKDSLKKHVMVHKSAL